MAKKVRDNYTVFNSDDFAFKSPSEFTKIMEDKGYARVHLWGPNKWVNVSIDKNGKRLFEYCQSLGLTNEGEKKKAHTEKMLAIWAKEQFPMFNECYWGYVTCGWNDKETGEDVVFMSTYDTMNDKHAYGHYFRLSDIAAWGIIE